MTDLTPELYQEIAEKANTALARQVEGYQFKGAWPEAEQEGLTVGTIEEKIFTSMFLDNLQDGIPVDTTGRIMQKVLK